MDLLICTATPFESSILRERLHDASGIRIVHMGVGPVNAAHAVTLAIAGATPNAIIICGVGGAYAPSGLRIGDVACADLEIYGDLGADSPTGFLDMEALGFPVVAEPTRLYNEIPMQLFPSQRRVRFVTVSTCTGTTSKADAIHTRTGAAIENMEGAAVAHVAHLHRVPVGEIRGVSNMVIDRDTSKWQLKEAAAAAQEVLLDWISITKY